MIMDDFCEVSSMEGGLWPCFAAFAGGPEFVIMPLSELFVKSGRF